MEYDNKIVAELINRLANLGYKYHRIEDGKNGFGYVILESNKKSLPHYEIKEMDTEETGGKILHSVKRLSTLSNELQWLLILTA